MHLFLATSRELHLRENRIHRIRNLDGLTDLRKLFLSRNHITELAGLTSQFSLEELDLSNQVADEALLYCPDSLAAM